MNISYYTVDGNLDVTRGYGNAGFQMVSSLQKLGHKVTFDDPDAPIQIAFCQPAWQKFHDGQYKIGYVPWESTELPSGWVDYLNQRDEVWATSEWVSDVFLRNGVLSPIHVYKHGLDPRWAPVKRERGDVVKFLHVGEPALRKGGQMAIDAFRRTFGDRTDVHLTVKAYGQHYLRIWKDGEVCLPEKAGYNNITVISDLYDGQEMRKLFAEHDCLVYPSYGEGFGLIPLQALGTGMPVISTGVWAPYRKFLGPLELQGRWDRSIWSLHPGDVYYPDFDNLQYLMLLAFNEIDSLQDHYYAQAQAVHDEYNWSRLTSAAFERLEKLF